VLVIVVAAFAARTVIRNRDWRDNSTLYAAAVRDVPGSAKAHFLRGNIYLGENQFELARAEFKRALEIYPEFPDTIEAMGLLESRTGNQTAAVADFEKALQMSDRKNMDFDYMAVNLAAALLQAGRTDDALTLLDRETSDSPKYARAWSNRAVVHLQRSELAAARSDAESALRLDPQNSQAHGVLNKLNSLTPFSRVQ
jgi:tetratricopeptide (TPR) repeat protein